MVVRHACNGLDPMWLHLLHTFRDYLQMLLQSHGLLLIEVRILQALLQALLLSMLDIGMLPFCFLYAAR